MVPLLDYTTISGVPLNEFTKINNIDEKFIEKELLIEQEMAVEKLFH